MDRWIFFFIVLMGMLATVFLVILLVVGIIAFIKWNRDRKQQQHAILRNFPFLARARYVSEQISPQLKQYFFEGDLTGKPYSHHDYVAIVKTAKYAKSVVALGSKRDFDKPGFYIRNAFFPKQLKDLDAEQSPLIPSKKYIIDEDTLLSRKEHMEETDLKPWLYRDSDAIVFGAATCRNPWHLKSPIGMSAMSYGGLGQNAIKALSYGIHDAKAFMNTGEGGITPYHLEGGVDLICQIGPGKFGFRDKEGNFSWDLLAEKSKLNQVKAFELKLGQGAKIRGGHIEGVKVTPEIAKVRNVEPYKTIDSPNCFEEFDTFDSMMDFVEKIRDVTGKPVGIKIVIGAEETFDEFASYMKESDRYPDFLSIDGSEGGSGATYKAMADSVGLPIIPSLMIANRLLRRYGIRDRMKIIASGKLFSADRIALALSLGADAVQVARGLMIAVGCILAEKCHSNQCPVGVATTDPKLQKALVVEEKRYRVTNYIVGLREELFMLAASAHLSSPRYFSEEDVVFVNDSCQVKTMSEVQQQTGWQDFVAK